MSPSPYEEQQAADALAAKRIAEAEAARAAAEAARKARETAGGQK
ncbi:hypothetical protein [Streptomyces halstedii]